MAIIPVKVENKKGNKIIETYAFLDPGSTDCFCTETLLKQLQMTERTTDIILHATNKQKFIKTAIASDLEISGLKSKWPGTSRCGTKDAEQWPDLKEVKLPKIYADIVLLIGSNLPKALEPCTVISSQDSEKSCKNCPGMDCKWTL